MSDGDARVVVFDGYCHLCSGWARFLVRHQPEPPFRLVAMQSDEGRTLLIGHGIDADDPVTFLVVDAGRSWTGSSAAIHVVSSIGGGWRVVEVARLMPRPMRDALYRWVARNRYRWFGRRQTCYLPSPGA